MTTDLPEDHAGPDITEGQLLALRNLQRKSAGEDVACINIADARALTELGLAERNPEGWNITAEGQSVLNAQDARLARERGGGPSA